MEIGVKCVNDKFSAEAFLGYSPEVDAEDKDQHLLRNLVSRSDCDGDAWLVSLHGRYNINLSWFVTLQADYIKIDTDGKSTSHEPGEEDITIYQEIESTQTFWSISVGYPFN
jgi:outer membrane protease